MITLTAATPTLAVSEEEVSRAIEQLRKHLLSIQQPDGSWEPTKDPQVGGLTALVTLALLSSGEPAQDPQITRAIDYLKSIEPGPLRIPPPIATAPASKGTGTTSGNATDLKPTSPTPGLRGDGTYALGVRCHVWAQLPPEYLGLLNQDAKHLLMFNHNPGKGNFHYARANGGWDNSTTQYGVLGAWEASKRGATIPRDFWEAVANHFMGCQNPDGGWQYSGTGSASSHAMTAAGLTGMFIIRQELFGGRTPNIPATVATSIDRGLAWLDKNYTPNNNWYYMYGVERVGLASGRKYFNGVDWYQSGAQLIVSQQIADPVGAAFALLFLSHGRQPVWISKLQLPRQAWEINPHDLQYLSRLIGNTFETEQHWQIVSVNSPPEEWLNSPILFIASDKALDLTDDEKARIKRYIDLGGMVVATPNGGSPAFRQSVVDLAKQLYPDLPMQTPPPDHPLFNITFRTRGAANFVRSVSNGARDLILLTSHDWSAEFQGLGLTAEEKLFSDGSEILRLTGNLWTIVTNRNTRERRLASASEYDPVVRAGGRPLTIGMATVGNTPPVEPATWDACDNAIYKQTGLNVSVQPIALVDAASSTLPLIHLTGTDTREPSEEELKAIQAYVAKGGTLLIETVGGEGEFSRSMEARLNKTGHEATPMVLRSDRILTGTGITGGVDTRRAVYRRAMVLTGYGHRPRFMAIYLGQRPAIIFSHEDLSLGLMNYQGSGVMGYTPETCRKLMGNLLLSVSQRQ